MKILSTNFLNSKQYQNSNGRMFKTARIPYDLKIFGLVIFPFFGIPHRLYL